jgi:hypothetical protein
MQIYDYMLQVNDSLHRGVIVNLFAQFCIFIPFLTNHWSEINVCMADDSSTVEAVAGRLT